MVILYKFRERVMGGSTFVNKTKGLTKGAMHKNLPSQRVKAGFTLAEVLITLGIIGVVAAMTIPNLIQNQQEKATIAKLNRVYSILSQSYLKAVDEYGTPSGWGLQNDCGNGNSPCNKVGNTNWFDKQFRPYVKLAQVCADGYGCFKDDYVYNLDGSKYWSSKIDRQRHYFKFVLMDGTSMMLKNSSSDCSRNWGQNSFSRSCGHIIVDLDGKNGRNTFGRDVFMFVMTEDGYFPAGHLYDAGCSNFTTEYAKNKSSCAAGYVLKNNNMDYLHWKKVK